MKTFSNILYSSARGLASMATLAIALLAGSALSSCSDDNDIFPSQETREGFFLTINVPRQESGSRAGENDPYNEFAVKCLDLFFYDVNANESSTAIYHTKIDSLSIVGTGTIEVNIRKTTMENIFGANGTQCKLYAVANYRGSIQDNASPSNLKGYALKDDFKETRVQDSFAMISENWTTVTLSNDRKTATGSVTLSRA